MDPRHAPPVPLPAPTTRLFRGGGGIIARSLLLCIRCVGATVLALTLVWGSSSAAHATPEPDHGPESGGISVTVPAPAGPANERIAAGPYYSAALNSDGNAYAWGSNFYGRLGDGTLEDRGMPVQVAAPAGVTFTQISAGVSHTLALGSDGNAYAWGGNYSGQLGDGTDTSRVDPAPVAAPAGISFTHVAAGAFHSVALGSDGNAYAWGQNSASQLGDDTLEDRWTPVQVAAPAGVAFTQVSVGNFHAVALGSDGKTYAWGSNFFGRLGDGTHVDRWTPVQVAVPAGVTFTQVSAGTIRSLALGSDGNTYAWGANFAGALGDGTDTHRETPVQVLAPAGIIFTQVSAGTSHSVALGSDGHTYAWGNNSAGQLGDGSSEDKWTPVQVAAPAGVAFTQVSTGTDHTVALGADGNAYVWGANSSGQLGDGTHMSRATPTLVRLSPAQVTEITFDGVPGTELRDNGDGTWSVAAPAHTAGVVEVLVFWTVNGVARTPVSSRFTYDPTQIAPTITDPRSSSVRAGDTAKFSVTTTGMPTPAVSWQVSRDGGASWEDPSETPDPDGQSLTVVGSEANHGFRYRAVAVNSAGSATSRAAELSVVPQTTTAPPQGTDPPKRTTPSQGAAPPQGTVLPNSTAAERSAQAGGHPSELASTGSAGASLPVAVAAAALFLGGGATVVARSTGRRMAK